MTTRVVRLRIALLGLVFLSGCESFLPLRVGFLNDGDTTVELLINEKILTVKPKEYALTNAQKYMQICLNGILQIYSFDTSKDSRYWKYIRNSRILVRLNNEGKLWYSMNKDIKQQEDELALRIGAQQDQIRCAKQSMPGKQ
jgi:hypothetical protein